ncbi:hypothetical protein TNCV_4064091 [Trichonephila clavipes]|nr:hypothetical protein TNCV_4064091 [Trichonephila clavipes]
MGSMPVPLNTLRVHTEHMLIKLVGLKVLWAESRVQETGENFPPLQFYALIVEAYDMDRDVIDFSSGFQENPCGHKVAKHGRQVVKIFGNSLNLVAKNDGNVAESPIICQVPIETPL